MYDKTLVIEILLQIIEAINIISYRFKPIQKVNDFTDSPAGMEKLDAICISKLMQKSFLMYVKIK